MTTSRPASSRLVLAVGVVAVIVVAAAGLWYLFFREAGPAPVSLGTAAPATQAPTVGNGASTTAPPGTTGAAGATAAATADGISGTWTVDPAVGSFLDFTGSFVGYRVRETLASIGATEAVGRTPDVTGSMTVDGSIVTDASFTADLTTLQSDEGRRDGQLRRQALETERFPTAVFTLTTPLDLGPVPADGATVELTATGDLQLHGVTKSVDIPLQARLQDGVVTIAGSLPIAFADFDIARPQSMAVLSVEDNGVLELQLQLTRD